MNRFLSASLLATVSFLVSCNDDEKEPDYPIEPYIESADIKFVETPGFISRDTLNLSFYFRDGDMDLGLDTKTDSDLDSPYHYLNLYLQENNKLVKITTGSKPFDHDYVVNPGYITSINRNSSKGKLATVRTRKISGFENLPEYVVPYACLNYNYMYLLVDEKDKSVFDESYTVTKTLPSLGHTQYVLVDTFYYEINENHYNISVDFLVKQSDESFIEFDWRNEYCSTFDGRFALLKGIKKGMTIVNGPLKIKGYSSKDGEFRYSMASTGFKTLFGGKTIKLRIKIKDRALHDSNVIETNEIQI